MIKKLFTASFYAFIAFSVLSYLSVMFSLLKSVGDPSLKPVANIGFPFKYYYQFWLRGSDSPNCGWVIENFTLDIIIIWSVTLVIYFRLKKKIV
ncbi:hypothetical protein [Sediminitomix flava]|uniref:Uncharacterized protein n=1 Tax=Sediminitomix flava TaxID=379075 RepID=A0A315Z4G2_SEDFL|nr:hypothetical protein [Sediminitomix flava]PWJ37908.1 hypothetical protein BC781_10843 [Sediminitomix flava]